jgi:hypothetical protein
VRLLGKVLSQTIPLREQTSLHVCPMPPLKKPTPLLQWQSGE